jgi:hypothetical protein
MSLGAIVVGWIRKIAKLCLLGAERLRIFWTASCSVAGWDAEGGDYEMPCFSGSTIGCVGYCHYDFKDYV